MYNENKIKIVKRIVVIITFMLGMLTGVGITVTVYSKITPEVSTVTKEEEKEKQLDQETVKNFLIAYYTKKDLGENRNRYLPFMTSSMYKLQVEQEDLPVNQAYKGYVLNQVFDGATIYIDESRLTAIATVNYTNLNVLKKGSSEGTTLNNKDSLLISLKKGSSEGTTLNNKDSLLISFSKEKGKYLVNNIERIEVTTGEDNQRSNRYSQKKDDKKSSEEKNDNKKEQSTTGEEFNLKGGLNLDGE